MCNIGNVDVDILIRVTPEQVKKQTRSKNDIIVVPAFLMQVGISLVTSTGEPRGQYISGIGN